MKLIGVTMELIGVTEMFVWQVDNWSIKLLITLINSTYWSNKRYLNNWSIKL